MFASLMGISALPALMTDDDHRPLLIKKIIVIILILHIFEQSFFHIKSSNNINFRSILNERATSATAYTGLAVFPSVLFHSLFVYPPVVPD